MKTAANSIIQFMSLSVQYVLPFYFIKGILHYTTGRAKKRTVF